VTCTPVNLPGGGAAIICTRSRSKRCKCGHHATLACDWKLKRGRRKTCDAPLCPSCTMSPATDKDLCPTHAAAYRVWLQARMPPL